jgi:hydroxymethylglutaryl-CoA lyase
MSDLPKSVSLREVGPRDGLQNEPPVPTDAKVRLLDMLSQTGLKRIEAVSFVLPRAIPQMADADEVWSQAKHVDGIRYSALVPNLKGTERALAAGFRELEIVVSASDTHNPKNITRSTAESLADIEAVAARVHEAGATLEVIVSTSFGCPYEGEVPVSRVLDVATHAVRSGADRLAFGDTTGVGTPLRVAALVDAVRSAHPDVPVLMHFHNTRGTALANLLTAMQHGITEFDASVGGLGGCPYAPGASGNVATEEVVHMLEDMGIDTGVDLEALLEVAAYAQEIVGHELPSGVLKAGPRTRTVLA